MKYNICPVSLPGFPPTLAADSITELISPNPVIISSEREAIVGAVELFTKSDCLLTTWWRSSKATFEACMFVHLALAEGVNMIVVVFGE